MNDLPKDSDTIKRITPHHYSCNGCGGFGLPLSVLDSRQGKSFRLIRCIDCNKMGWTEE